MSPSGLKLGSVVMDKLLSPGPVFHLPRSQMDEDSLHLETPGVKKVQINKAIQAVPNTFETASYTG